MLFEPDNFLYWVKQIVTGTNKPVTTASGLVGSSPADGGFNRDVQLPLNGVLQSGTTFTTASGVPILSSAASSTALTIANYSFIVPRDYDQASDKLHVRIFARMAAGTDTPVLTVSSSTTLMGGTVGVASSTAASTLSSTIAVYELSFDGLGLVRDEIFSFQLSVGVHNTDAVQIFGVQIVYFSTLVAYIDEVVTGGVAVGYDALGQPLR